MCLRLAAHIDGREDKCGLDFDALKHGAAVGLTRRQARVDEDFVAALRKQILAKRRAGRTTVAETNGVNTWALRRRDLKAMEELQRAGWRRFDEVQVGVFHMKEDGARLGQPAKDYSISVLYWPRTTEATVLPPQVVPACSIICDGSPIDRTQHAGCGTDPRVDQLHSAIVRFLNYCTQSFGRRLGLLLTDCNRFPGNYCTPELVAIFHSRTQ